MKIIFLTAFLLSLSLFANELEKVYGWDKMDWIFDTQDERNIFTGNNVAQKAPLAGVHIDDKGIFYISVPRWMDKNIPSTLNKIVYANDKELLQPYPTSWMNSLDNPEGLRNVLGFCIDAKHRMWILDKGDVASITQTPKNGQKIVVYDMDNEKVIHTFLINDNLANRDKSFLNDITVDVIHDVAYISDSGIKSAPFNETGIIVYDLKTNKARRVLNRDKSTINNPRVNLIANGEKVFKDKPFQVGINGIAVSYDGKKLFWSLTTGREFYMIETKLLRDFSTPESQIAKAVKDLGSFGGSSDGITIDKNNNVYITDLTNNRIVMYSEKTETFETLVQDKKLIWPDTVSISKDRWLYFSVNRLHKAFAGKLKFNNNKDNFEIWRAKMPQQNKDEK